MEIQSFWNTLQNSLGQSLMQWLGALTVVVAAWLLAVIARAATHVALSKIKLNDRMQDALGTPMNWQGLIAGALFWLVILLGLGAALNTVELNLDSGPLSGITNQLLEFTPRLLAAAALGVVAWLAASIVRGAVNKAMSAGKLDDKLPTSAHMPLIGERLGQMLFWLVILLFVPAVLQALDMRALLDPVNAMLTQALSFVPNIVAAVVVGGVGWLVAKVLQQLVMQLLSSMGSDD
jgi:flagellar biosynthesis protein FliQ